MCFLWNKRIYNEFKFYLFNVEIHEFREPQINIDQVFNSTNNCKCRSEKVYFSKNDNSADVYSTNNKKSNLLYQLNSNDIQNLQFVNCDLYNVLRRGPNQKVIGYSLYGSNKLYYKNLKKISRLTAEYFPNWTIRVHYDDEIDKSIICETECLKNEQGSYFNNVDFCRTKKIPFGASSNTWDAGFMHAMTWRWLPLGDSFVDYFMSRDTDSCPSKRELDSVNVWMDSYTKFHVMRGNIKIFL
jgi:hypothetical protein